MGYADGWPLDAVSVEAFTRVATQQPFIADYGCSHALFYKLQQLSGSMEGSDAQSLYSPLLLQKKEQNCAGMCLLIRVLDAENLFSNAQQHTRHYKIGRKASELNPFVKVYMVTSTSTQMQEQAVAGNILRNEANPHFDEYFWLWVADANDNSDAWKKKLVYIEIWHKADIGSDTFLGGTILTLGSDDDCEATNGLSLEKDCCHITTVNLSSLRQQHAKVRKIKEQFFGRSSPKLGRNQELAWESDEEDESFSP